ncbi:TetR family transcriptional regulator [Nocardia puris]|uniref:TetR family transcriptional regulator n=2 Tax=Nocardia puris TaxID=208602 RepID=A0A366D3E5_9NOCA|nr:TetR family transcriptional regulator [Nocardia puris]MBF6214857.1 TetR family transcriptional regulator [Nocardia puris]MBF6364135.1 TetR family transcriptional regulator [Nocardia puris]MBF6459064.1 TetR family transcriptional regulator [Nocardia puris]RBO84583.1 TetR family transcriptional regulator [Nocardia puris]
MSLRERKQLRAREAIVEAAHELFAERGFDHVTVADIAARAEVGRATFFRYFGDKQEVVFADSGRDLEAALAAVESKPGTESLGRSLPEVLVFMRTLVLAFVAQLVQRPVEYREYERLIAEQPELHARSLVKQRGYIDRMVEELSAKGVEREVATLAAEIGMACYFAGRAMADNDPRRLPDAIRNAFDQLGVGPDLA